MTQTATPTQQAVRPAPQVAAPTPATPAGSGTAAAAVLTTVHSGGGKEQGPAEVPAGTAPLRLQAPPANARAIPQPMVVRAMPLVMLLAAGGMVAVMLSSGVARNPLTLMFPAMMALSTVAMLVGTWQGGNRRLEMAEKRRDYLRYLDLTREELREDAAAQHSRLVATHPAPQDLLLRHSGGPAGPRRDGLNARLGLGVVPLERPVVTPDSGPVDELEPVCVAALRRLVHTHCSVRQAPVAVDVASFPVISCYGEVGRVRALVRALLAQLAVHHGPEEVQIAAALGNREARHSWDLLKWLPHHADRVYADGAGTVRLTESDLHRLERLLGAAPDPDGPHLVIVVDGDPGPGRDWLDPAALPRNCTIVEVCSTPGGPIRSAALRGGLALELDTDGDDGSERLRTAPETGGEDLLAPDELGLEDAAELFRALARTGTDGAAPAPGTGNRVARPDFLAELGHGPSGMLRTTAPGNLGADAVWSPRTGTERLRVPIGADEDGAPIHLDLKESAHGGHGPHGLCIGATGSGKSEFLRTLVLALVATHSPEQLNLVLVDFKGGATFHGMESLHHVAASITNLADEEALVDRMRDALEGELVRRQEVLRAAGCANVAAYERRRAAEPELGPLPALFVVVDEFSEMLSARPEFIDLFVQIGRLGRSLQIHLLLASQRLEEGRLRGLESHLSYRIALKTFSAGESRSVLGTTDAYTLPGRPGAGYLKVDASGPRRFDAAYVSGPLMARNNPGAAGLEFVAVPPRLREFSARYLPVEPPGEHTRPAPPEHGSAYPPGASAWQICATGLAGLGPRAHEIWLAPLPGVLPLSVFGGTELVEPDGHGGPVPWAVVDRPFEQRRDLLALDLDAPDSAALVVGAPRSGKSTALCSLALSAALRHRPDRLHLYAIDYGGGLLADLADLPHTAGIATRGDTATARRILSELAARVRRHERGAGPAAAPADGPADRSHALLLIDGWQAARADLEDLDTAVGALAAEGLGAGVHVVVTAARAMDVRPIVRDALSTRLELRLVDPADSMLGRRAARVISPGTPGRGVVESGHLVQLLAPDITTPDHDRDPGTTGAREAATHLARAWDQAARGATAPRVRLLPELLPFAEIASLARPHTRPAQAWHELRVPVGIDEADLAPAYLDLAAEPLTLVFGNSASGKTSLLRGLARATVAIAPAADVRVLLVDFRRRLRDLVPQTHLAGIAATEDELAPMITQLAEVMRTRLADLADPDAEVTGPRIVVLVDDIDLVVGATGNPLAPLVPLLAHAREIGLSLVLTRRVSGAARAAFDPVVQRMRDLGAVGLVLDGTKDEGRLVGDLVARPLPPGRAQFYSREAGVRLWQLALVEP